MHLTFPPKSQWRSYADRLERKIKRGDKEVKIRKFLSLNPWILSLAFGMREGVIFSEYRLAANQQPDHLVLSGRSLHAEITIIEMKAPKARILTSNGAMSGHLNQAMTKTIQRQNILNRRQEFFLPQFNQQIDELLNRRSRPYQGVIDPHIKGKLRLPLTQYRVVSKIVIGQRHLETVEEKKYRVSVWDANNPVEIIPYDRLLDHLRAP